MPMNQKPSQPRAILAIDQGTSSTRAILFDYESRILGQAQQEFTQYYPAPGQVEHDADEIWRSVVATVAAVLAETGLGWPDIAACGLTNQRETVVVWERESGRPIAPAIVWQCRRTADVCRQLQEDGYEALVRGRTGLEIDAYFSATKFAWLLDHVPGARARAEAGELLGGTIDSWLIWKLSGGRVHATDFTNAARTLLLDIHRLDWDEELLELFRVPRQILPELRASGSVFAAIDCAELGACGIPVSGVAGDQQAALYGQLGFEPGVVKSTYGTGAFILQSTGNVAVASGSRLLTTVAAWREGEVPAYALEGSVFNAGSTIQWLRDELGLIASSPECDRLAETVPDAGGVRMVPAFTGLGAPWWEPDARGVFVGLSRGTGRAEICRAVLESIAQQVADVCLAMAQDSGRRLGTLRVDGGASRSDVMMQYQADLLGAVIERPELIETTALGAAYLAGLTVGFWTGVDEIRGSWRLGRRFEPQRDEAWRERERRAWLDAIQAVSFDAERRRERRETD